MESAVVGATVQVLLETIFKASIDEINRILGSNEDLTRLRESLALIQDFIADAEVQRTTNQAVHKWLKQLEDVAFEADCILDRFTYELLRRKVRKQNGENKVMGFIQNVLQKFVLDVTMSHKIRRVTKNIESINNFANHLGLQIIAGSAHLNRTAFQEQETHSFLVEPDVFGRDNDVLIIANTLVSAPLDQTISVLPIVGMGGLGKTTVARQIFNHQMIETHFQIRIWLSVSTDFGVMTLFKSILEILTRKNNIQGIMTKEAVLKGIKSKLKSKRFLLVLDDLWNEDYEKWREFIGSLSGVSHDKGNCILATTRAINVALEVGTLPTNYLGSLKNDDCWLVIKSVALSGTGFENIGKRIAQKCQGLPLVARVVGSLLRGRNSIDDWLSFLNDNLLNFRRDEDSIMRILKLSYDRLPSPSLKKCFAFCSTFPQDFIFETQQLVELWMAEGFLQGGHRNDVESVGYEFISYLLQHSLLQEAYIDQFGNLIECKMRDFVHNLACVVSGRRTNASGSSGMHQILYRVLKQDIDGSHVISKDEGRSLRTVVCYCKITDNMLSRFKCLRSLLLHNEDIEEMPPMIEKLIHLRLLDISHTRIKFLPDSIGKLHNLQTLSVSNLVMFPNSITDLISLRHLHVLVAIELPPGIEKLSSLQTLEFYIVGYEKGCWIEQLGKLNNLKGKLHIQSIERVLGKEEAKCADLVGKPKVDHLILEWNESEEAETRNHENVLDGLQPSQNLKKLEIDGYQGKKLTLVAMNMKVFIDTEMIGLDNLIDVSFTICKNLEEIPMLGHLPHLKVLTFNELPAVERIGLSFYGLENCSTSSMPNNLYFQGSMTSFRALETLILSKMPKLIECLDVEGAILFPRLETLLIQDCPNLKSFPSHLPSIVNLTLRELNCDLSLTNVCSSTNSLVDFSITCFPGLIHLPHDLFVKNQNIRHLMIEECPKLTHLVPRSCAGGASLMRMTITECENLKELPFDMNTLHSLKDLEIGNCQKLTNLPSELLESCTSLETLQLYELESLANLDTVITCIWRMSNLEFLNLYKIPQLMNFPTEISRLRDLRELKIGGFAESLELVSFNASLGSMLQENRSLQDMFVHGQEHWDSLPDNIQYLTTLKRLYIRDFGVEVLPEWLGNLSSLQMLGIENCQRLRNMPSKEAMLRLTDLFSIDIKECPLLKERCRPQGRNGAHISEWPKISHVKEVRLDDCLLDTKKPPWPSCSGLF